MIDRMIRWRCKSISMK